MSEEKCTALCDFTAMKPDELSFTKGDVITVIAKGKDSGYWEGRIGERRGMFPNCFVSSNMHPTRPPTFCDYALAMFPYKPQRPGELGFEKHDLIHVTRASSSAGWFYGINVTAYQQQREGNPDAEAPTPLMFPSNYVACNLVKAQYCFTGRQRCELSLQPGDVVLVHRRWNDGWWEGSCAAYLAPVRQGELVPRPKGADAGGYVVGGMRRGIFPSNYTTSNVATLEGDEQLFCARCRTVMQPKARACKECARNEEIVRTMMSTLEDIADGTLPPDTDAEGNSRVDIFAHVDLDPSKGKGALLNNGDLAKDGTTVRPRLAV